MITFVADAWFAPRLYRYRWPMDWDYGVMAFAFVGAVITATLTTVPAWALGLYGFLAAASFIPGTREHRQFYLVTEASQADYYYCGLIAALFGSWMGCRLMSILRPANLRQWLRKKPQQFPGVSPVDQ
ncbi:MAG: hypothetical protein QM754_16875 [Tepidisphaeraceae bacterium]